MLSIPEDLAILKGVLGLATTFRREPIAEGVESLEHGKTLLQLGCEMGQGYVIARPMPAADIPSWVDRWQPDPCWKNQRLLSGTKRLLIDTRVDHRAWVQHIEEFIDGVRLAPPELGYLKCDFGQWLNGDAKSHYGGSPVLLAIIDLHKKVHVLAATLVEHHLNDRKDQVLISMDALHLLRDSLLGQLDRLLQES